jgi:hypothetical protein
VKGRRASAAAQKAHQFKITAICAASLIVSFFFTFLLLCAGLEIKTGGKEHACLFLLSFIIETFR